MVFLCMQKINFISNFFFEILHSRTDIVNLLFWELWKCLIISIKIIVSICSKFSCLPACKKSTSSFTFYLRYCREMANVLFWVNWACLAKHTFDNYQQGKINSILYVFLEILQRYYKVVVLGALGMPGHAHPK